MAQQGFILAPVVDWTENAGLYSRLHTWQRDVEFLFRGLLNKETYQYEGKLSHMLAWRKTKKSPTLTKYRIHR